MASLIQILQTQLSQIDPSTSNAVRRIFLKKVLQAYVLGFLYNHKQYRQLNFYGGSCLRIIFGLNRMSEDIDLDNSQSIDLSTLSDDLKTYFRLNLGAKPSASNQQSSENNIFRITLKFPILYDLQISQHKDENLHLKIEVSQHRQVAIIQQTPVILYGQSFVPGHFSIETLMAGKLLACLERNFSVGSTGADFKARDYYDVLWLMQKQIMPLSEKLSSDGKKPYSLSSAINLLQQNIEKIKIEDLRRGLYPLFENREFISAWCDSFFQNFSRFSQYYLEK